MLAPTFAISIKCTHTVVIGDDDDDPFKTTKSHQRAIICRTYTQFTQTWIAWRAEKLIFQMRSKRPFLPSQKLRNAFRNGNNNTRTQRQ